MSSSRGSRGSAVRNPVETYQFSVQFQGNKELFTLALDTSLTTVESIKNRIEIMYHYAQGKQIKIAKLRYAEMWVDLAADCSSNSFEDAPKKYGWKQLKDDDDVRSMFNQILIDPKGGRLYAMLN
jgi:hypothetical protein